MGCSPPGSSVHGIFQARIPKWVAISSPRGMFPTKDQTCVSYSLLHWQAGSLPLTPPGNPRYFNSDLLKQCISYKGASQVALVVKSPSASAGEVQDMGLIPGWRRSPGGGHDDQLQYSCLEKPMDRGAR